MPIVRETPTDSRSTLFRLEPQKCGCIAYVIIDKKDNELTRADHWTICDDCLIKEQADCKAVADQVAIDNEVIRLKSLQNAGLIAQAKQNLGL